MKRLGVIDIETDPFEYGRVPEPFCCEYFDGAKSIVFWGHDCIARMVTALEKEPPCILYAHNGGKFDFLYFLEYLHADMRIVNSRIIQAHLGKHELRDSYAILPFPLRDFDKDEIDYDKMTKERREANKEEILTYLHKDCTSLHQLVLAFHVEFGDGLTIGGSSLKQLKTFHKFASGGPIFDAKFRKDFYFGGRNQVFQSGIIRGPVRIYDINSSYPYSMKAFQHPVSVGISVSKRIEKNTCFVVAEGFNRGAFPVRKESGGLDFTVPGGRFCTTIHEWRAALETNCFTPTRIIKTYGFEKRETFAEFIDHFYEARAEARRIGDKIHTLFYKFVLNSSYGKFAQNPANYSEYCITRMEPGSMLGEPWTPAYIQHGKYIIWEKPLERQHFYNVCTGASITGASRSLLLRGIAHADGPLYCDTDSIICKHLSGVPLDDSELGAWKVEGSGDRAVIAGKKLYAIFDGEKCIKKAHKGARLTPEEICKIAAGEVVECKNPVPAFGLDGVHKFTTRRIRRTV